MAREKLSSDARQLIDAMALDQGAVETPAETDVLVRTKRQVSSDDRSALESLGATVRTVAGDILTARVPVDRLDELAELDVVTYVEISRPLVPERTQEESPPAGDRNT